LVGVNIKSLDQSGEHGHEFAACAPPPKREKACVATFNKQFGTPRGLWDIERFEKDDRSVAHQRLLGALENVEFVSFNIYFYEADWSLAAILFDNCIERPTLDIECFW
jgi:hypothetical protein